MSSYRKCLTNTIRSSNKGHIPEQDAPVLHLCDRILRIPEICLFCQYLRDTLCARIAHRQHDEEFAKANQNIYNMFLKAEKLVVINMPLMMVTAMTMAMIMDAGARIAMRSII